MSIDQIIEISKALLTPLLAIVAAYIALQQLKTNRRKLKLDLFEKRYVVFEKIGAFIGSILTTGTVQAGREFQFLADTKAAGLLFGDEISRFVSDVYGKAVLLHALEAELTGSEGESRKSNIQAQREIKDWYVHALEGLEACFKQYLKLEH
jgi:hypothetical protein